MSAPLLPRIGRDVPLKAVGTTLGMSLFFAAYFQLLHHPASPPVEIALTWLDQLFGFHPLALVPYVALWPYVSLLPALLVERREMWGFAAGCAALSLAGLCAFRLWPTVTPPPGIDWSAHPSMLFLKNADQSGNACPSLHAAFAVFTCLWFARLLPRLGFGPLAQTGNVLVAALIVWSTLGTKQHVALDALFGALLGSWVALLNFILCPPGEDAPTWRRPLFLGVLVIKLCAILLWTSGLPAGLALALFVSGGVFVLHQIFVPEAGELVRVFTRFTPSAPEAREAWLTLDDGPDPADTPRILDLLDHHRARATFFLIGERAARHPELVSEIRRRGHEIAHHTHTHPCGSFWCATPARVARELDSAFAPLSPATGAATPLATHTPTPAPSSSAPRPTRFRAPVGFKNLHLGPALAARGLRCVGWTVRSGDTFARDADSVAARVAARLRPGAIILMHEGPPLRPELRVAAVAKVLAALDAAGYRAVTPPDSALRR